MGYDAFSPGSTIADPVTPIQAAYRALPVAQAQEALEIIEKLTRNTVRSPAEEKFRKINLSNPKITATITNVPGAVDFLKEVGWVQDGDSLVLPPNIRLVHEREVLMLIEAKDYFKKAEERENKRRMRARKDLDPQQAALRTTLEFDKKERLADAPITFSSKAQAMPGDGARICRAADIGLGS
jgi:hypothetical protein